MIKIPSDQIDAYRTEIMQGPDGNLVADIGYFSVWFSNCELGITTLLAFISGQADFETFDELCGRMETRAKIAKLKRLSKNRGGIGKNLKERLSYFDEKIRPFRNTLIHSHLGNSERSPGKYYAASLSRLPWLDLNEKIPVGISRSKPAKPISPEDILGYGAWLTLFSGDLSSCLSQVARGGKIEITHPKSKV